MQASATLAPRLLNDTDLIDEVVEPLVAEGLADTKKWNRFTGFRRRVVFSPSRTRLA